MRVVDEKERRRSRTKAQNAEISINNERKRTEEWDRSTIF
jgi:hypothetical protein